MIIKNLDYLKQLSTECETIAEVADIDKQLRAEYKRHNFAIGLAAPQIGILKRIFLLEVPDAGLVTFVHPKILFQSSETTETLEGCLSFPGTIVRTTRPKNIHITDATEKILDLVDLTSAAFQHELDHLDGVLFMDRGVIVEGQITTQKIDRNKACPCGKKINNKPVKFKNCHGKIIS